MRRPRTLLAPALSGLACLACTAEEPAAPARQPNIVFVSIDSLRADHLGCYGYERDTSPFMDRLAATGVRFENAVSTTSWTLPSHASMFTGLYGETHGLVDNGLSLSADHLTLAELLGHRGYATAGFFGGPYLHPAFGLGQGFEVYESCMTTTPDSIGDAELRQGAMRPDQPSHADVTGPRTREEVRAWADGRGGDQRPYFLFLHLWDVHYDFIPPPEYARLFVDPDYAGPADGRLMSNDAIRLGMQQRDLQHVLDLYDAEIRFTDAVLEGILGDLTERGMLEDTLVVITSDHGEEFFEHGLKGHNKTLFDEVLRIPLIVSWEGQIAPGQVVEDQVQLVDLMPTFAGVAGLDSDLAVQGQDLTPLLTGGSMEPRDALSGLFIDGQSQRALRSNRRKVLSLADGQPAIFIDLIENPIESQDQAIFPHSPRGQTERKQGELELRASVQRARELRGALGKRPPNQIELSPSMQRVLDDLGYTGGDEDVPKDGDG